jgi:hypothetical protein
MKAMQKRSADSPSMKSGDFDAIMRKALGVPRPPDRELPKCGRKPRLTRQKTSRKSR